MPTVDYYKTGNYSLEPDERRVVASLTMFYDYSLLTPEQQDDPGYLSKTASFMARWHDDLLYVVTRPEGRIVRLEGESDDNYFRRKLVAPKAKYQFRIYDKSFRLVDTGIFQFPDLLPLQTNIDNERFVDLEVMNSGIWAN